MSNAQHIRARLTARRKEDGVLLVEIAGDWLDRKGLPDVAAVEKELADSGVKAVEFAAKDLGRWDSALLVRILAVNELCAKAKIEFRTATLPDGLAKLIALAQAVPEKTDAARKVTQTPFLQREVSRNLKLRYTPHLRFVYDESVAEGDKIERLLKEIRDKENR